MSGKPKKKKNMNLLWAGMMSGVDTSDGDNPQAQGDTSSNVDLADVAIEADLEAGHAASSARASRPSSLPRKKSRAQERLDESRMRMNLDLPRISNNLPEPPAPEEQFTWDCVFVFDVGSEDKTVTMVHEEEEKDANGKPVLGSNLNKIVHKRKEVITQREYYGRCTADIVNRLERSGVKTSMYYSVQKDEIYCMVGVTEKRLMEEADRIEYDLQLDESHCMMVGERLGVNLARATKQGKLGTDVWLNIFGKYDQPMEEYPFRQDLYMRHQVPKALKPEDPRYHKYEQVPDPDWEGRILPVYDEEDVEFWRSHPRYHSLFTSIDRIKLTVNIIEADEVLGGGEISMSKSIAGNHSMIAFFPLHEDKQRKRLMDKWYKVSSAFGGPLDDIRNYFGEQIAFYFAFLSSYNIWLLPAAIVGLGFFIWQLIEGRVDVVGIPAFAVFIAVWATLFLEAWKRSESSYRIRWGMTQFKSKEQPRPEFHGDWEPSPVNGRLEEQFPTFEKIKRQIIGQSVVWSLIGVVIASVAGIFFLRNVLQKTDGLSPEVANYLTAFLNALQIQALNYVYGEVAYKLNDYENHRTDSEYENALIAKTFLFKFVNSYNSLFYIAFIKRHDSSVGGCHGPGNSFPEEQTCMRELQQQLFTIFASLIVINNLIEVLMPMMNNYRMDRANRERDESGVLKEKSPAEKEFELSPYESTFDDFDELVIQFGYVTLFAVAFPIAPLLALFNNMFETRIDSTKVCQLSRRPEPRGADSIGVWGDILSIISVIAVITNIGIICFTTFVVEEELVSNNTGRYMLFIGAEHVVILLKFGIAYFVPDEPEAFTNHIDRQTYIVSVLLQGMQEDDDIVIKEGEDEADAVDDIDFDWAARVSDEYIPDEERSW